MVCHSLLFLLCLEDIRLIAILLLKPIYTGIILFQQISTNQIPSVFLSLSHFLKLFIGSILDCLCSNLLSHWQSTWSQAATVIPSEENPLPVPNKKQMLLIYPGSMINACKLWLNKTPQTFSYNILHRQNIILIFMPLTFSFQIWCLTFIFVDFHITDI